MIPAGIAPVNGSGVLARIRTEQRRLEWLLAACDRPRMPERVLTLLEDSLLGLREAGDQLEHVMPAGAIACGCLAFPYPHTRASCAPAARKLFHDCYRCPECKGSSCCQVPGS